MTSEWGWRPEEHRGLHRAGSAWMQPLVTASPWLTVLTLVVMFHLIGGALTKSKGLVFELPATKVGDGEATELVAMVIPSPRDTLVFFDDARYQLGDPGAMASFRDDLADRLRIARHRSLLVLVDSRVTSGDIMKFSAAVKSAGVERLLFAEKREEAKRE